MTPVPLREVRDASNDDELLVRIHQRGAQLQRKQKRRRFSLTVFGACVVAVAVALAVAPPSNPGPHTKQAGSRTAVHLTGYSLAASRAASGQLGTDSKTQ